VNVVDWEKRPNHLYVGRACGGHKTGSKWGNPFKLTKYTREVSLEMFEQYLLNNATLINNISELNGMVLGCWCKPLPCHADILVRYLNMPLV
jgi:hypothetical protein